MKTNQLALLLALLLFVTFYNPAQAQRRRLKPQTKGSIIGTVAGGTAGALINRRNRVVGGIVGGAIGGTTGYLIGKNKDNKNKAEARIAAAEARAEQERERREVAERAAEERAALAAAPSHGLGPAKPVALPAVVAAKPTTSPYVLNASFLTNTSYGDQSTAYGTSIYRRKSW
jgi:hypothetical protein